MDLSTLADALPPLLPLSSQLSSTSNHERTPVNSSEGEKKLCNLPGEDILSVHALVRDKVSFGSLSPSLVARARESAAHSTSPLPL